MQMMTQQPVQASRAAGPSASKDKVPPATIIMITITMMMMMMTMGMRLPTNEDSTARSGSAGRRLLRLRSSATTPQAVRDRHSEHRQVARRHCPRCDQRRTAGCQLRNVHRELPSRAI